MTAQNEWQPIETAYQEGVMHPDKNGIFCKRVLLFYPPYGAMSGHWNGLRWVGHSCLNREAKPTHWMPLPQPPEDTNDRA